ncbi:MULTISPECIES: type 1 glutamine amidotransferase [unclassified Paraflavitalea]|uniref:type 1 glutamine amidotransferase n=1 Tax=unclassified Paraflavitalea TaxID=2798305 RepID=UPI003D3570ED
MLQKEKKLVKVAILDLYEGAENQGMRCIRALLKEFGEKYDLNLIVEEFDVRRENKVPSLSHDIYISSGGPGSPIDSEGSEWEKAYFEWLDKIETFNNRPGHVLKKHVLFICHSFQLACRYFDVADVVKRKSTAFGVFPVHKLQDGKHESLFDGLLDPFYAVDSRDYQVIRPRYQKLREMGASILCIEKDRPHVPLERAIMAIRFNDYMVGTQFHPEADAEGMTMYLMRADKKQTVIENHGFDKWKSMLEHLNDPDKILWTYSHLIPNFLKQALDQEGKG